MLKFETFNSIVIPCFSACFREVESNVTVTFASTSESPFTYCEVMLKEHILTGLYVDLYQTQNNYEFGGPKVNFYAIVIIKGSAKVIDRLSKPHLKERIS